MTAPDGHLRDAVIRACAKLYDPRTIASVALVARSFSLVVVNPKSINSIK